MLVDPKTDVSLHTLRRVVWASGRSTLSLHSKEKKILLQNFFKINKMFDIFYVLSDKLNGCSPSLILMKELYSLQNFHSFDRSHYMLLSRNKNVQFFVTSLLVVILVMLLSYVERKFDFFIFE